MKKVFKRQSYQLDINEHEELYCYIKDIYNHDEFQKRCTNDFCHHDQVSLGRHILEDTIVTYKMYRKKENIELDIALLIDKNNNAKK